jgi:hypothetical protein
MAYITLHAIDENWRLLQELDISNGGIVIESIKMDSNIAYEMDITITPQVGDWWEDMRLSDRYGIILNDKYFKLPFVKGAVRQKQNLNGTFSVSFYSALWLASFSQPKQIDRVYNQISLKTYLSSLDDKFDYLFCSNDITIAVQQGLKNNFDTLKEKTEEHSWVIRDNGMSLSNKPELMIGLQKDIGNFDASNPKYEVLTIDESTLNDNFFIKEGVFLDGITVTQDANFTTHLYAYLDNGLAGSSGSRITFNNPNASYIRSDFYLELIDGIYWIVNKKALENSTRRKFRTEAIQLSASTQDVYTQQNMTVEQVKESVYKKAIKLMQQNSNEYTYNIDIKFKGRLYLPGTRVDVKLSKDYKFLDGRVQLPTDIDTSFYLRNISLSGVELRGIFTP